MQKYPGEMVNPNNPNEESEYQYGKDINFKILPLPKTVEDEILPQLVDKTGPFWGGIHPGTYSGTRGGPTSEANDRFLNSPRPSLYDLDDGDSIFLTIPNEPVVKVINGSMSGTHGKCSGYTPEWDQYVNETPYTVSKIDPATLDRLQRERQANMYRDYGAFGGDGNAVFDPVSLTELCKLAEGAHVDIPVLWNPTAANGNGSIYGKGLGNAEGSTMRRILPKLQGMLKHPDEVTIMDTEMDIGTATAEAIFNLPKGMGKVYSEELDDNSEVIHMRFGNPYHNSDEYVKDLMLANVKVHGIDQPVKIDASLLPNTEGDFSIREEDKLGRGMTSPEGWISDLIDNDMVSERPPRDYPEDMAIGWKPERVVVLGGPRNVAMQIMDAATAAGIEVAKPYDDSTIIGNPDMRTLNAASLSLKHLQASPYAHGKKSKLEDLSVTMRKDMRKAQDAKNKSSGFGKRLTKRDKLAMAVHKDGWRDPSLVPYITKNAEGKEVLSFRRKKDVQTYVTESEHITQIKVPTKELNFTTSGADMEWKTTATVKDGKVTDVKVTDVKHTLDGECKDID